MRSELLLVLAACGSTPAPAPALGNHGGTPPSPLCEDKVVGPLYAPTDAQYLVSESELARRQLDQHKGAFLGCYTREAMHRPDLEGHVILAFKIDKAGKATDIVTTGFDAQIDHCICDQIVAIKFDTLGGTGTVRYPIDFHPQ